MSYDFAAVSVPLIRLLEMTIISHRIVLLLAVAVVPFSSIFMAISQKTRGHVRQMISGEQPGFLISKL